MISNFHRKAIRILDSAERRIPKNFQQYAIWNKENKSRLNGMDALARERLYYIETVCTGYGD